MLLRFARPVLASIIASLILFSAMPAAADSSNWYVSGSAGGYLHETRDYSTTISNGITSGPGQINKTFDPGYTLNAAVGYKLPSNFRVEGEIGYTNYQPSKINPTSGSFATLHGQNYNLVSGGDLHRYSATLNGFYDIPLGRFITPYVGIGAGAEYFDKSTGTFQDASGNKFIGRGGNTVNALVLGEVGINFDIGGNFSLAPAYRYYHYFNNNGTADDAAAHVFKVGLRYSF